jgi:hypothetical protein
MSTTATVKIEAAYFDTAEGEQFFDKYTEWKNGNAISEDIKRRREKIAAAGLTSASNKPAAGVVGYVKRVLEESGVRMTLKELTAGINAILKEEGKGEVVSSGGVSLAAREHCKNFVTVEGKGKAAKYTFVEPVTTASSVTPKKKKTAVPA